MFKKSWFLKIFALFSFLAMVFINALANILPINGISTGDVSDKYSNLFAPAGFTFSIWGLIYLLLGAYTLYQLGLFNNNTEEKLIKNINKYFIISSWLNFLWILAWHYDFIALSVLIIVLILLCLIKIANHLKKERLSTKEKILLSWPFSIYFGWITVATIANITTWLVSLNWNGFGVSDLTWLILVLLIGAVIGVRRGLRDKNIPYLLVFMWAYFGIWFKHTDPNAFNFQYPAAVYTILFLEAIFFLSIIKVIRIENKA